ncbi:SCO family protein [Leadbetterella byssophila]|jgi:protein SCO1/2|uniref:Electron transport protein SCO1/SenC n=1 Tax=Leadbetterella byssophila (strain DSM 17132 / JCM 16389 / KACC 11308 / NBRC 106382 / 4M15) TaxID=649349 RepID=E4RWU6_LEAB4|nr:SCO family protein [Leadbetterella byssophila]ADQ17152.1 electron transport protein SCO1/SenC [Leadbetterella byssophila DSM 17132]
MKKILIALTSISIWACSRTADDLPVLGPEIDGVAHQIPDFTFVNQDGDTLTQEITKDKIYVADFFFSTCPTICPVMKTQMLRIYEKYKDQPDFLILSHSINPRYDTPEVLKEYKEKLGIHGHQWQFLTGNLSNVYELAQKSYLTSALEDSTAVDEGGFIHSGAFVLVDKDRHIRAIYDGTKDKEVDKLMADIDLLLKP